MADDILAGLDTVPWELYQHAYGPAVDTPTHIRALLSERAEERAQADYNLVISITHQGTLYEATIYAVPFLIRIVDAPASKDKGNILSTLGTIAQVGVEIPYIPEKHCLLTELDTPEARREVEIMRGWELKAHAAVCEGRDVYLRLLSDPDSAVWQRALGVLVNALSGDGARITPIIRQRIAGADDPHQRARLARALAEFLPLDDPTQAVLTRLWHEDTDSLVQLSAAVALAHGLGEQAPAQVEETLSRALVAPEPNSEKRYNEVQMDKITTEYTTDLALGLRAMGARGISTALPRLLDALAIRCAAITVETLPKGHFGAVSHKQFIAGDGTFKWRVVKGCSVYPSTPELRLTDAILTLTCGWRSYTRSVAPMLLTPAQRMALSAIARYDVLWHFDATMDDLLDSRNLPYSREGLRAYLLQADSPN
jgi:hypothetical protein